MTVLSVRWHVLSWLYMWLLCKRFPADVNVMNIYTVKSSLGKLACNGLHANAVSEVFDSVHVNGDSSVMEYLYCSDFLEKKSWKMVSIRVGKRNFVIFFSRDWTQLSQDICLCVCVNTWAKNDKKTSHAWMQEFLCLQFTTINLWALHNAEGIQLFWGIVCGIKLHMYMGKFIFAQTH